MNIPRDPVVIPLALCIANVTRTAVGGVANVIVRRP